MVKNKISIGTFLLLFCFSMVLMSCASPNIKAITEIKREIEIPEEFRETKVAKPAPTELKTPDFVPVTEDVSPMRTRIVDISARNTPLRDVLHIIAEATSLNLVMEKGVDSEVPVTITLKNVAAEYALNTIFSAVDYFYEIKENLLIVKALDTKIFELGHPAMIQTYSVDVGGDILGGAIAAGGGGGGGTTIKGNIAQTIKSDESAFKFWDTIEKSIGNILGTQEGQSSSQQSLTVHRLTGTVYVTASKRSLQKVENYINVIKKVINRQVIIEAKVIEVQLSDGFQFGIDWNLVDRYVTNISGTANQRVTGSMTYGTTNFNTVVSNTGPMFAISGVPSFGGRRADLRFVINALQQQGEVRTLSNPKLNIMNGQTALLSVGRNETYIAKIETTTTASNPPITTFSVSTSSVLSGIMIGIIPYINENGEISLTITPIISEKVKFEEKKVGNPPVVELSLPTIDLRELSTTVKVRDSDIVIIGGLISKKEKLEDNQVPFLGNIPLLGLLFKSRDKLQTKTELVVIIQPILVSK